MKYAMSILAEAESDMTEAYQWYEERRRGLGAEFLGMVDACLASIQRNPFAHAQIYKQVRRALLKKFPFGIFYIVRADTI